jgi:hypothetical protein
MSSPNYLVYMVRQEQNKDMLRAARQQRLIRSAGPRPSIDRGWHRRVTSWTGHQMNKLGSKLRSYVAASS